MLPAWCEAAPPTGAGKGLTDGVLGFAWALEATLGMSFKINSAWSAKFKTVPGCNFLELALMKALEFT
jgi:hypothetical protein